MNKKMVHSKTNSKKEGAHANVCEGKEEDVGSDEPQNK